MTAPGGQPGPPPGRLRGTPPDRNGPSGPPSNFNRPTQPRDGATRPGDGATRPGPPAPPATGAPRRRRAKWLGLAAVLVVLVVVAAGLVATRPAALFGRVGAAAPGPLTTPAAAPSPVLAAAGSDAPVPSADAVAAALRAPLADGRLGAHVAVRVVDAATGQQLFARNATDPTTPASTMKLATATALLALRGPGYQIRTRVVAGNSPGEVVIIGSGDPTLAAGASGSYAGAASLTDLADRVKRALGGTAPTKVIYDSSLFSGSNMGPHWDPDDVDDGGQAARITALMTDGGRITPSVVAPPSPRYPKPDQAAAQQFAKLLGVPTTSVAAGTAPASSSAAPASPAATAPAPGTQLGAVTSPPLVSVVEQMLSNSDNTIAEMMARQVALARGEPASFAGGAKAVVDELNSLGLPTAGIKIVDGSGLSADDKLTTQLLTGILALAVQGGQPQLHSLFTGLPVAGYSGTLATRFRSPSANPADGDVRAKTGTLTGVHTLAGYVTDAKGRLLVFAAMADKVTAPLYPAEDALDQIGTALVRVS